MRLIAREIVDSLTFTPVSLRRYSHLSKELRPGTFFYIGLQKPFCALRELFGRLPGAFPAESERPSLGLLSRSV
jgi:hypothetical protein